MQSVGRSILIFAFLLVVVALRVHAGGWTTPLETGHALCTNGIDDDFDGYIDYADQSCLGWVTGYVTDQSSNPVANATVYLYNTANGYSVNTSATGYYEDFIIPGTYSIFAANATYRSDTATQPVQNLSVYQVNLTMRPYSSICRPDCTTGDGVCNVQCLGFGGCSAQSSVLASCDGYGSGNIISYGSGQRVQCCTGTPYTYTPQAANVSSANKNAQSMVIVHRVVVLNGVPIELNVLTYQEG